MREAVIVSVARTPVGRYGGKLASILPYELGAVIIQELLRKNDIEAEEIDDVIFGNVMNTDSCNIARLALLEADMPDSVPGITLNRQCGSGLNAIVYGSMLIKSGYANLIIAGGVESDSRRPFILEKAAKAFPYAPPKIMTEPPSVPDKIEEVNMGITAENLAEIYKISREECDEFAVRSHSLSQQAWERGFYDEQVVPIEIVNRNGPADFIKIDETLRPSTSMEGLARLRPAFKKDGVVTAGNSSPLCDGAAGVLIMEKSKAVEMGLEMLGRITGYAVAGVDSKIMGIGPVASTRKLLKAAKKDIREMDLIELNEAFSAQAIPCIRELEIDMSKVNINGGAISHGHPMGGTGAILVGKALYGLKETGQKTSLVTMCIGGGQGISVIVEKM